MFDSLVSKETHSSMDTSSQSEVPSLIRKSGLVTYVDFRKNTNVIEGVNHPKLTENSESTTTAVSEEAEIKIREAAVSLTESKGRSTFFAPSPSSDNSVNSTKELIRARREHFLASTPLPKGDTDQTSGDVQVLQPSQPPAAGNSCDCPMSENLDCNQVCSKKCNEHGISCVCNKRKHSELYDGDDCAAKRPLSNVSTTSTDSTSSYSKKCPMACTEGYESEDVSTDDVLEAENRVQDAGEKRDSVSSVPGKRLQFPDGMSYLEKVVAEIVETERTYVRDLQEIIEGYLGSIVDTPEIRISPEDVCALFGNIEEIHEFNSGLLQDLEKNQSNAVEIAKCFVKHSEGFTVIYTEYCTSYPKSMTVLTQCMNNKESADFFRICQLALRHGLPLGSYLLKPVQRILKYHLLLKNMLKNYDREDESGTVTIGQALATMENIAQHINDMKRKHEHTVRVQEIQSLLLNWRGNDLTTYGELVLEDEFKIVGAKGMRLLLLFDKVLIICKRRSDGPYICKAYIECSNLMLIESIMGEPFGFHVIPFDNPKCQYTIEARSLEQKREWTQTLKRLILENYMADIPEKAKEIVMQLGQDNQEELLAAGRLDKGDSHKKQHQAPEYLEKRKAMRRKSDGFAHKKKGRKRNETKSSSTELDESIAIMSDSRSRDSSPGSSLSKKESRRSRAERNKSDPTAYRVKERPHSGSKSDENRKAICEDKLDSATPSGKPPPPTVVNENSALVQPAGIAKMINLSPLPNKHSNDPKIIADLVRARRSESFRTAVLNEDTTIPPPVPEHAAGSLPLRNLNYNNNQRFLLRPASSTGEYVMLKFPDRLLKQATVSNEQALYDNLSSSRFAARSLPTPRPLSACVVTTSVASATVSATNVYDSISNRKWQRYPIEHDYATLKYPDDSFQAEKDDDHIYDDVYELMNNIEKDRHVEGELVTETTVSVDLNTRNKPFKRKAKQTAEQTTIHKLSTRCESMPDFLNRSSSVDILNNHRKIARSNSDLADRVNQKTTDEIINDLQDFIDKTPTVKPSSGKFPVEITDANLLDSVPLPPVEQQTKCEDPYEVIVSTESHHHAGMIGSIKHILESIGNKVLPTKEFSKEEEKERIVFTLAKAYSDSRTRPINADVKNRTTNCSERKSKSAVIGSRLSRPIELGMATLPRHRPPRPKKGRHKSEPPSAMDDNIVDHQRKVFGAKSPSGGSLVEDENYGSMSEGRRSDEILEFYACSDSEDSDSETMCDQCSFEKTLDEALQTMEEEMLRDSAIYSDQEDETPVFSSQTSVISSQTSISHNFSVRGKNIKETINNIENLNRHSEPGPMLSSKRERKKSDTINELLKTLEDRAAHHQTGSESQRSASCPSASTVATKLKELQEQVSKNQEVPTLREGRPFSREISPAVIEKLEMLQDSARYPKTSTSGVNDSLGRSSRGKSPSITEKLDMLRKQSSQHHLESTTSELEVASIKARLERLQEMVGTCHRRKSWEFEDGFLDGYFLLEKNESRPPAPGWVKQVIAQLQSSSSDS